MPISTTQAWVVLMAMVPECPGKQQLNNSFIDE